MQSPQQMPNQLAQQMAQMQQQQAQQRKVSPTPQNEKQLYKLTPYRCSKLKWQWRLDQAISLRSDLELVPQIKSSLARVPILLHQFRLLLAEWVLDFNRKIFDQFPNTRLIFSISSQLGGSPAMVASPSPQMGTPMGGPPGSVGPRSMGLFTIL